LFVFLILGSGAIAQQQCALWLTDATPTSGQYYADVYLYYDGSPYSWQLNISVYLDRTNYIPFDVPEDIEENLYEIKVWIKEPGLPPVGSYDSSPFNTDYWLNNDIDVVANLQ
jgi:hypothetical protein